MNFCYLVNKYKTTLLSCKINEKFEFHKLFTCLLIFSRARSFSAEAKSRADSMSLFGRDCEKLAACHAAFQVEKRNQTKI